ncbi:MAG TPA: RidA family protein [Gemmatimonadetes bacterium]|nr:RidA family protein [Gemmatimonadota bacterium]
MKRSSLMLAVLAVLVAVPVAAQEGPRIAHQNQQGRPFSPAIQVGNMYWLSGKIGASGETRAMTEGRVGAETHNIMRAFQELLQELGMTLQNTVRAVVYLTDIDDYGEMNEAYSSYFQDFAAPSRVAMEVSDLVAGSVIEISFIAVKN